MALKVQVSTAQGTGPNRVQVSTPPTINTNVRKVSLSLINLEELKNVNTSNLEDGATLVWNETEQRWDTQQIQSLETFIDGGTY